MESCIEAGNSREEAGKSAEGQGQVQANTLCRSAVCAVQQPVTLMHQIGHVDGLQASRGSGTWCGTCGLRAQTRPALSQTFQSGAGCRQGRPKVSASTGVLLPSTAQRPQSAARRAFGLCVYYMLHSFLATGDVNRCILEVQEGGRTEERRAARDVGRCGGGSVAALLLAEQAEQVEEEVDDVCIKRGKGDSSGWKQGSPVRNEHAAQA